MELSEFVVAALIADLASHPLQDLGIPMINGLVPIFTLFCCEVLITGLSLKSIRLRGFLFGKPSFLIVRGKIDQAEMRKAASHRRADAGAAQQKLHGYKLRRVRHTRNRRHAECHPLPCRASRDSRAAWDKHGGRRLPSIVTNDGRVIDTNLQKLGLDRSWLNAELKRQGRGSEKDIFLMTVNQSRKVYISVKEAVQ